MSKEEVLFRIHKLDLLYSKLNELDKSLNNKQINKLDYLRQELKIKEKIEKVFKC
jgi:hypothetical protein